jgi:hypothetical protein
MSKMAEKCTKTVMTVKQKFNLTQKLEYMELVTQLPTDYGIGTQTTCEIKNNKMKLMEFVRNCDDSGASHFNSNNEKVNAAFP